MLKLENVCISKNDFELKNISFEIKKNEYFVILGRTGAGKTLLLETIAGLHKNSGNIFLNNNNITKLPPEKRNIGFVYQDFALFPHLKVKDNIEFAKKYKKCIDEKEFSELIYILELEHLLNRKIENLSGGEKQRIALARAIYSKPLLLLLDEPLSAIDPGFRNKIMDNLKILTNKFDLTIIHVTHNFREATYLSDKVAVMLQGEIKQQGDVNEILQKPRSMEIAKFLGFKNIFSSKILNESDKFLFSIDPFKISISDKKLNTDYLIQGKIEKINEQTDLFKIYVKSEDELFFVKTGKTCFTNNLRVKDNVFIGFNKEDLHRLEDKINE